MKKVNLLIAVFASLLGNNVTAQTFTVQNTYSFNANVVVYATDVSTCNTVGISNVFSVPSGTNPAVIYTPGVDFTWNLDPSTCGCTWQYEEVAVSNSCGVNGSSAILCPQYDFAIIDGLTIPCLAGPGVTSCLTIFNPCGGMVFGDNVHIDYHTSPAGDGLLQIN